MSSSPDYYTRWSPQSASGAFSPVASLDIALRWLFGATAAVTAWALLGVFAASERVSSSSSVFGLSSDAQRAVEDATERFGVMVLLSIPTAVVFIIWTHRVACNAESLGQRGRFSRGWGIGGWFIPIANYFIPFAVLGDAWKITDAKGASDWKDRRLPAHFGWWWGTWVVGSLFVGGASNMQPDDTETASAALTLLGLGLGVQVAAALLAIKVVVDLSRNQEAVAAYG